MENQRRDQWFLQALQNMQRPMDAGAGAANLAGVHAADGNAAAVPAGGAAQQVEAFVACLPLQHGFEQQAVDRLLLHHPQRVGGFTAVTQNRDGMFIIQHSNLSKEEATKRALCKRDTLLMATATEEAFCVNWETVAKGDAVKTLRELLRMCRDVSALARTEHLEAGTIFTLMESFWRKDAPDKLKRVIKGPGACLEAVIKNKNSKYCYSKACVDYVSWVTSMKMLKKQSLQQCVCGLRVMGHKHEEAVAAAMGVCCGAIACHCVWRARVWRQGRL
jgi:hypothetical protein